MRERLESMEIRESRTSQPLDHGPHAGTAIGRHVKEEDEGGKLAGFSVRTESTERAIIFVKQALK